MSRDAVSWFEIPTRDLDRAQRFYEQVLGRTLRRDTMDGSPYAAFPCEEGGATGCLMLAPGDVGATGAIVYLDAAPSLDAALARALAAGGRIATPRTALPPGMGFFAHIEDLDGQRVGLHALA